MGINLTFEYAKKLIDEAIEERGTGFVYERPPMIDTCKYVHGSVEDGDATPGCGVGLALHKAGVPLSALENVESTDAEDAIESLKVEGIIDSYERKAVRFLYYFQGKQDFGHEWGVSRRHALEAMQGSVFED